MTTGKISKGIIKDIIIVVIGVLAIWIALQVIFGTENPFFVVSSGSMVPELEVYDVIIVQGNTPFEDVKVGDIIVFYRPSDQDKEEKRVIVHRVASIIDEDPFTIRTKGDANPTSIPGTDFPITDEEYIGQVSYVVPQVGYITRILTPPINYIIIAVIVAVMIAKQISKSKKEKKLSFDDYLDSNKDTSEESPIKLEDLDEIPKDSAYTNSEKEHIIPKIDEFEQKVSKIEEKIDETEEKRDLEDSERKD